MIIHAQHISKTFPPRRSPKPGHNVQAVLSDINFSIERPQIVGLIGPNGAGKTTLLKILSSLILADSGQFRICGCCPEQGETQERKLKACLGLVTPEERSFYWRLSGRQNLELFAVLFGLSEEKASHRINELFRHFRINNGHQRFDTYSTGIKRKFALMRAMLHHPKVVLLDEPTKSLDWETSQELRRIIRAMPPAGQTILMATHNLEEAQDVCDRFLILRQGKLLAQGTLDELRTNADQPCAALKEIYQTLTQNND